MKKEVAIEQFSRMLRTVGDVAQEYGVRIAIEPLNKSETNLINTLAEGLEICRLVNHPNVFVLNDFYHSDIEGENYDALHDAKELLIHTHTCDRDRNCPTLEKDGEYIIPAIRELASTGYDARVSFECGFKPDFITALKNARSLADELKSIQ
jgi:sugar phosphate isomerase/epimerase